MPSKLIFLMTDGGSALTVDVNFNLLLPTEKFYIACMYNRKCNVTVSFITNPFQ
jgi:hypothetical protein